MNDRMSLRNKVALVTGVGWPTTANGAKVTTGMMPVVDKLKLDLL
jgi:hypothetical protein